MKRTLPATALLLSLHAAGLAFLTTAAAPAATMLTQYTVEPIVKLGDQVADVTLKGASGSLNVGTLNDQGQIAMVATNTAGGDMLLQYTNGQFVPITVVGRDAPGGKWARGTYGTLSPVSMNQRGDIAFATYATIGGTTDQGTFRWDFQSQKVTTVAFQGMPAVNGLTFVKGSDGSEPPLINKNGEIAFAAQVKNAAGQTRSGVFLVDPDGPIQAVALPDQVLPDGAKVPYAFPTGLTDDGVVAFATSTVPDATGPPAGAYLWEKGTITPIGMAGTQFAGFGKAVIVGNPQVNNNDHSVVLPLARNNQDNSLGFYRWTDGPLTPLFVVGQVMPGGDRLGFTWPPFTFNDRGQFAFTPMLSGDSSAAFRVDPDGMISLILHNRTATTLGTVTQVGPGGQTTSGGIGLNSKGQVALPVQINGGPYTLVLLTPTAP